MMRSRRPNSARLTHVATVSDSGPTNRRLLRRLLTVLVMTGIILAVFFSGRYWGARILARQWQKELETVSDDRADMLVASAARLGRPGLPVLVSALGSPRESVAKAGRRWLDRQLTSWENVSNRDSQRNVAALAEALASQIDSLGPVARLDAARLAARLLKWRLDGEIVARGRVIWLCDRVLQAADYDASRPTPSSDQNAAVQSATTGRRTPIETDRSPGLAMAGSAIPQPLRIPDLPLADDVWRRVAQPSRYSTPNVVPLPDVASRPFSTDLADAWSMRGERLPQGDTSRASDAVIYPSADERVLVPPAPDVPIPSAQSAVPMSDVSLSECMRRLHSAGLETLAAEGELKRRGFDALRLSIARRVYDPDRRVRLQLVRELPGIPGIGATDWLIKMAADEDKEVRLAAITLLATVGDPGILAEVELIARNDPAEQIRQQAQRLAKRRQSLNR